MTPTYEYYYDDHQDGTPDAPPEQLTPTPEIGENYLNMELILPRSGTLARGRVTERKRDPKGNVEYLLSEMQIGREQTYDWLLIPSWSPFAL